MKSRLPARGGRPEEGLAQQRYAKSHRIFANGLGLKDFGQSGTPMTGPVLVGQFWGLDSDRILKLVLREIILDSKTTAGSSSHNRIERKGLAEALSHLRENDALVVWN